MNHCQPPVLVSRFSLVEPLMRRLRLHVDYGHSSDPNAPALHLFAEVIQDAG